MDGMWDLLFPMIRFGPINLGNTIKNSNTIQLNGQMNFVNLYNKVGYLKEINNKYRNAQSRKQDAEKRTKTKIYTKDNLYLRKGRDGMSPIT